MFVFVIKNVRERKNISLYKLAKLSKLSYSYLSELENNKIFNPSLQTMYKIANVLKVKIDKLFYTLNELENLKKEMYKRIDKYGINSKEVFEVSQIIDLLINVKMRKRD